MLPPYITVIDHVYSTHSIASISSQHSYSLGLSNWRLMGPSFVAHNIPAKQWPMQDGNCSLLLAPTLSWTPRTPCMTMSVALLSYRLVFREEYRSSMQRSGGTPEDGVEEPLRMEWRDAWGWSFLDRGYPCYMHVFSWFNYRKFVIQNDWFRCSPPLEKMGLSSSPAVLVVAPTTTTEGKEERPMTGV